MGGSSQTRLKNWKLLEYSANPVRSVGGGDGEGAHAEIGIQALCAGVVGGG